MSAPTTPPPADTVIDRQPKPAGTLPPHARSWLLIGVSLVIVIIIALTGDHLPHEDTPPAGSTTAPAPIDPARIVDYEARLRAEQARLDLLKQQIPAGPRPELAPAGESTAAAVDPLDEERRRRAYTSLFASNVAFTRREGVEGTSPDAVHTPAAGPSAPARTAPSSTTPRGGHASTPPAAPETHTLTEGTMIEGVLVNRLDGTYAGPVTCLVSTAVRSRDRQHMVIPAGTQALGTVTPVTTFGQSRLAISFHRLVFPNGRAVVIDGLPALNAIGETALHDRVNRHYAQLFGASLAVGLVSGLAQAGSRGYGLDAGSVDVYRQGASTSLAGSTARILDRYLNVLPTLTIREGHRIRIYLTGDLSLPTYVDQLDTASSLRASIDFERIFYAPGTTAERRRQRAVATVHLVLRDQVPHAAIPYNPLGLTIVYLREDVAFR